MSARRPHQRGAALLLVLWIFMILGVIALDFAQYMRDDAMAAVNFAEESSGYYVALAGMNRALFDAERLRDEAEATRGGERRDVGGELLEDEDAPLVPPDGQWHEGEFAGGRWAVRMTDEGSRLSLNKIAEGVLTRVVTNLFLLQQGGGRTSGLDKRTADDVADVVDSILDWRDADDLRRLHGAEVEDYERRRSRARPKNGYFDAPEELLLVRGVTPELFYGTEGIPGLRDLFSVYSRSRAVNVRGVTAPVLQALLAVGAEEAAELINQRDAEGASLLPILQARVGAIDPTVAELLVEQTPRVVFVEARADVAHERNQARVAAVVDLASDVGEGLRILRWFDQAPWTRPGPAARPAEAP